MSKLNIALVQTPLVWHNPPENRNLIKSKLDAFFQTNKHFDLVVLPETFTTGFTMTPEAIDYTEAGLTISWMQYLARMYNTAICGSIVVKEGATYFNRFCFVHPDTKVEHYDKHHTYSPAGESEAYEQGMKRTLIQYKGFVIRPLICYDLRFPVWSRNDQDYDLLLYVANWPSPRIGAWDTLLRARAIENMSYCIGVNRLGDDPNGNFYPGHSSIYDPLGNQLLFSKDDGISVGTIDKELITSTRSKLNFLADRDHFQINL
jgi:predicted amidohydrolase